MQESETPASQSREESMPVQEEKKYTVKHNKQTVALSMEELLDAAEKGLDYDRIRPSHDYVKQLATQSGETDIPRFLNKAAESKADSAAKQASAGKEQPQSPDSQFRNMQQLLAEYPEVLKDGSLSLPDEVAELTKNGMNALEAYRVYDLARTKTQRDEFKTRLEAEVANRSNAQTAMGSLQGGDAVEKDYYSSKEWDRLPEKAREKYIRNGKIYEFMRKWSENL
jgi:hypothetical protein